MKSLVELSIKEKKKKNDSQVLYRISQVKLNIYIYIYILIEAWNRVAYSKG